MQVKLGTTVIPLLLARNDNDLGFFKSRVFINTSHNIFLWHSVKLKSKLTMSSSKPEHTAPL